MPHTTLSEESLESLFEDKDEVEIIEWMLEHVISGIDDATDGAYSDMVEEILVADGGFEDLYHRFSENWGQCDVASGEVDNLISLYIFSGFIFMIRIYQV